MTEHDDQENVAVMEREVRALVARVVDRGTTFGRELGVENVTDGGRVRRPQMVRRHAVPTWIGALAATAAVVALLVFLIPSGNGHRSTGSGSARGATRSGLTSGTGSFRVVGGGPQSDHLLCVTTSVCYVTQRGGASLSGLLGERTTDGGATWMTLAPLPAYAVLAWPLSCPTVDVCYSSVAGFGLTPVQSDLAKTVDGGRHWRMLSLPVPALIDNVTQSPPAVTGLNVNQLSCPTVNECTVYVIGITIPSAANPPASGHQVGYFLTTRNGGRSWSYAQGRAVQGTSLGEGFEALRCDRHDRCIGLELTGKVTNGDVTSSGIEAIRTDDGGKSWTASAWPLPADRGPVFADCGDVRHCVMAFGTYQGRVIETTRTADGGRSWRTHREGSWPNTPTSLSCATGLDCFVSTTQASATTGYANPLIEATHDGGMTWTASLALPHVHGVPLVVVVPISCPVPAGCLGVGATAEQLGPQRMPPTQANANREMVSELGRRS